MNNAKIREVVELFAKEAGQVYGDKLKKVILYGSCARGDFDEQSDIDIMCFLTLSRSRYRKKEIRFFLWLIILI